MPQKLLQLANHQQRCALLAVVPMLDLAVTSHCISLAECLSLLSLVLLATHKASGIIRCHAQLKLDLLDY